MRKADMIEVVRALRAGECANADISPLAGVGLAGYPVTHLPKECIVAHLRWQCMKLNGELDYAQLTYELGLLKKKVVMV